MATVEFGVMLPQIKRSWEDTKAAARTLGVSLQLLEIRRAKDLDWAFQSAAREHAGALLTLDDLLIFTERARIVALDERGRTETSDAFARRLAHWRDDGVRTVGFVIGGADGLDETVRKKADFVLSFGALTWPHMLVRAMLAEQIYRAQSILAGHPYHRG